MISTTSVCPEPGSDSVNSAGRCVWFLPVVELGSLFLALPLEIRCCSASKNAWGMWNTSGSGCPGGWKHKA